MTKEIWFDMDGTIADLYGEPNWLEDLLNENPRPYQNAAPLVNMNTLARVLNRLTEKGYTVNIVSWLCKGGSAQYNEKVTNAKIKWLRRHLKSVQFARIEIVPYGTYKEIVADFSKGILFDDEKSNRDYWRGTAYNTDNIIAILKELA